MGKRIVVGVDGSPGSSYALEWVLKHVLDSKGICSTAGEGQSNDHQESDDMVVLLHAQLLQSAETPLPGPDLSQTIVAQAKSICTNQNITNVETRLVLGEARDVICEIVEQLKPDLLVLGSHGHSGIKRAFVGSVCQHCMHHANSAVLVVKKKLGCMLELLKLVLSDDGTCDWTIKWRDRNCASPKCIRSNLKKLLLNI